MCFSFQLPLHTQLNIATMPSTCFHYLCHMHLSSVINHYGKFHVILSILPSLPRSDSYIYIYLQHFQPFDEVHVRNSFKLRTCRRISWIFCQDGHFDVWHSCTTNHNKVDLKHMNIYQHSCDQPWERSLPSQLVFRQVSRLFIICSLWKSCPLLLWYFPCRLLHRYGISGMFLFQWRRQLALCNTLSEPVRWPSLASSLPPKTHVRSHNH